MKQTKRYEVSWNNFNRAEFSALQSGDEIDPCEFPEFEEFDSLPKAGRRARSILRMGLDTFGCVMIYEEALVESLLSGRERWEPVRKRAMAVSRSGKIDWEADDWEPV